MNFEYIFIFYFMLLYMENINIFMLNLCKIPKNQKINIFLYKNID